jgi:TolB-like protein
MSSRTALPLVLVLLLPFGQPVASGTEAISTVAVFPVDNLSGGAIPADEVRQVLIDRLASEGIGVLATEALDDFMTRHRVRYAAGIDSATAEALRQETGVDGVLIASVELLFDGVPPKVALFARLVSTRAKPLVVWADDVGLAGDEAPGLLALDIVDDYQTLLTRALTQVTDSLLAYLKTGQTRTDVKRESKFEPRTSYRRFTLEPGRTYSVAVLPFFNGSGRRGAGEILALLFTRHLSTFSQFRIIDSGEVRQELLEDRIIMDGGVSVSDAQLVAASLDADFVLAGRVLAYQDYAVPQANPRVEFSTVLIERETRRVVWGSHGFNEGTDGVRFFGRGRSSTAHVMATQMARIATGMIAGETR